jgi:hypothetical protein
MGSLVHHHRLRLRRGSANQSGRRTFMAHSKGFQLRLEMPAWSIDVIGPCGQLTQINVPKRVLAMMA